MASLLRLLVLTLLGTARAPPPGNDGGGSDSCAEDGSSATYTETISTAQGVTKRTIVSAGCPNHESYCTGKPANKPTCDEEGLKGSGTEATDQDLNVDVPANPKLLSASDWAAVLADAATVPAGTATEGSTSSRHSYAERARSRAMKAASLLSHVEASRDGKSDTLAFDGTHSNHSSQPSAATIARVYRVDDGGHVGLVRVAVDGLRERARVVHERSGARAALSARRGR